MNRKIMSTASQIALNKGQALKYEMEKNEKEETFTQAEGKLDAGDAPTEDAQRMWKEYEEKVKRSQLQRERYFYWLIYKRYVGTNYQLSCWVLS